MTPGGRQWQFQVVLCLELKVEVDRSPQARLNEWDYRKLPTHKATLTHTHTFQRRGKTPGPWENGKHICFESRFFKPSSLVLCCHVKSITNAFQHTAASARHEAVRMKPYTARHMSAYNPHSGACWVTSPLFLTLLLLMFHSSFFPYVANLKSTYNVF